MAKFLNTSGVSYHLEEMIKNTKDRLILISPYLKLSSRIREHILNLNAEKKDIRIIYKENKLRLDENNWLETQIGVRTSICKNLHAKCYLNEKEAIITSMNLYEFSQVNNNEMGIYVTKEQDPELYGGILEEAHRLLTISEEIRVTVQKVNPAGSEKPKIEPTIIVKKPFTKVLGFCIRTGIQIPFNPEKPLSTEAFKSWNKYGDIGYPEKYCHLSGEASYGETSFTKPILRKNWSRAKELMHVG